MKITATLNISNKSYSGIKNHVTHDKKIKHSNKNIDYEKTQFNIVDNNFSDEEIQKIKEQRYQKSFEKYNAAQYKSRHKSNMYKDVSDFIKSKEKKHSFDKTAVATFGNKQDQDELLSGKTEEQKNAILSKESKGLADYTKEFNQRNKYLKIASYATNVDESTPHVHMQILSLGKTPKGKPSMSLNNALLAEYKYQTGEDIKDTRKALSWFREQEDNSLVKHVSRSLGNSYSLNRTHEHIADFDGYKKIKSSLDERQEQTYKQEKTINIQKHKMVDSKRRVVDFIKEKEPNHRMKKGEEYVSDEVSKETGYIQHMQSPAGNLFQSAWEIMKRNAKQQLKRLREFEKKLMQKAKELTDREERVAKREQNVESIKKRLDLKDQSLKTFKEELVAKQVKNGEFEKAKDINNVEPKGLQELAAEKLGKAKQITQNEDKERSIRRQREHQRQREEQQRKMSQRRRGMNFGGR